MLLTGLVFAPPPPTWVSYTNNKILVQWDPIADSQSFDLRYKDPVSALLKSDLNQRANELNRTDIKIWEKSQLTPLRSNSLGLPDTPICHNFTTRLARAHIWL
jgi:hypothetical protein